MYCPNCGAENQFEVRYCRRCGSSLEAVAIALSQKPEDVRIEKSQLTRLIKKYYSGRHEMIGGLGAIFLGIAVPAALLSANLWVLFWVFVWIFIPVFGGGIHQFNKGWKKWNEASIDLKVMGYDVPPKNATRLTENDSRKIKETGIREPSRLSDTGAPPSVTESTTRHLDLKERR